MSERSDCVVAVQVVAKRDVEGAIPYNIWATILHPNTKVLDFGGLFVFLGGKNASSFHYFCLITTLIYVGLCLFLMIDIALTPIIRTIMNGRPI